MVDFYLQSSTLPPNWKNLLKNSREKVTEEQCRLSLEWLYSSDTTTPITTTDQSKIDTTI